MLPRAFHGRTDPASALDVIIFDQEHVIERQTVVLPPAHAHGILFQEAIAGRCLARVQDRRRRRGYRIDEAARQRGNARQPLQEVQRRALGCQQAPRRAARLSDNFAHDDFLTVRHPRCELDGRVDTLQDRLDQRQASDYPIGLDHEAAVQNRVLGQRGLAGRVARPDVLGNR